MKFTEKSRAAAISIISNTSLILLKLIAGIITGSVSLLAEAIHSIMDLVAAIMAFISVQIADRPPDEQHRFGHGKAENISGVVEGLLIFLAAGLIANEAIRRLPKGATLEFLEVGIGVMAVCLVVDLIVSRYVLRVSKSTDSIALEADARHLTTDVVTMGGVLVALVVVRFTGINLLDPVIAIMVALVIMKTAYDITKKSFGGLMDTSLTEAEENAIRSRVLEHGSQMAGYHKLRTRKSGSQRYVDLHVVMPRNVSIAEAHSFCDHLERDLESMLQRVDVTIHVEPCSRECDECSVSCNISKKSP